MANLSITEYKQAISGAIAGVVLAFIGVDSYRGSIDPRPDPFTGKDARIMKYEMMRDIEHMIEESEDKDRKRIYDLEQNQKHCMRMLKQHDNINNR